MKTELRSEFQAALDKKVVSVETYLEIRVNEVHEDTTSTLEQLNEIVAAVCESQEKMWRAIDRMSKEIQELFQRDVGTEGGEETKPLPANQNLAKEEPIPAKASAMA